MVYLRIGLALLGMTASVYFTWQHFRDATFPRAARWLIGVSLVPLLVSLAAGYQVDRSNAGIHPEWITAARWVLGIGFVVGMGGLAVAMVMVVHASWTEESAGRRQRAALARQPTGTLPGQVVPQDGLAPSARMPDPVRRTGG